MNWGITTILGSKTVNKTLFFLFLLGFVNPALSLNEVEKTDSASGEISLVGEGIVQEAGSEKEAASKKENTSSENRRDSKETVLVENKEDQNLSSAPDSSFSEENRELSSVKKLKRTRIQQGSKV